MPAYFRQMTETADAARGTTERGRGERDPDGGADGAGASSRSAPGPGRPRRFCRDGCRQQAYLARKLASSHGLADDDVIVSRDALEELQSRLYCLQAALEDIDRDLARSAEPADVAEALAWLRENAEPLAQAWIEPRTAEA